MSFATLAYAGFLIAAWVIAGLSQRALWRQATLLLTSYLFYLTWSPPFLLLLIGSSVFNLLWGRALLRDAKPWRLWVGMLINLIPLLLLKYVAALAAESWRGTVFDSGGWLIPIGISFYTFQAISFQFDVYRGYSQRPGWIEFSLYMAFWPTILSGPICRAPEMIPQFRRPMRPDRSDLSAGLNRILIGLFMKVVLADTLASGINERGVAYGFDTLQGEWSALDAWTLAVAYGFQLYFDFGGYSHLAIGSALLFGIRLRENFDDPFRSQSVAEFWRRWHMSLSSWIRDYVFFPLAAWKRSNRWSTLFLVFSMVVFGVWHGATWGFLFWGLYQGLLLALGRVWTFSAGAGGGSVSRIRSVLGWGTTMLAVSLGWLIFRANSLGQSVQLIESLVRFDRSSLLPMDFHLLVASLLGLYAGWLLLGSTVVGWLKTPSGQAMRSLALPVCQLCMILLVIIWSDQSSPFVYVRF